MRMVFLVLVLFELIYDDVYTLLGLSLYRINKITDYVEDWQRMLNLSALYFN